MKFLFNPYFSNLWWFNKNLFSPAKSQWLIWCCNLAILKYLSPHHLYAILEKWFCSVRFDLIISMEVLRLGGICLSSCLIITISMWQFHEWRKLRDLHHLPLSQDHPLLYQRKCDFWIKDWHRPLHWPRVVIKAPDRSLHQDRIEGQVLSLCNANCSLYPCKNVYIADSVTRESREVVKCGANMLF